MSALTKIGIVLLVIASLLLSAGVVVFVNKVENFRTQADSYKDEATKQKQVADLLKTSLDAAVASRADVEKTLNTRIDEKQREVLAAKTEAEGERTKAVQAQQQAGADKVALTAAQQNLQGVQDQLKTANTQIADLRKIRDDLVNERHSLNAQLTDALARAESLDRARRIAEERAQGARAELSSLQQKVADAGFNFATLPSRTGTGAGTAPLEGVVTSVFNAGGKPWAAISLGSKDNVAKGMKFNVHNDKEFLGYLTIQDAQPTEAVGVLEGPGADKVKAQDHVKTQLQ